MGELRQNNDVITIFVIFQNKIGAGIIPQQASSSTANGSAPAPARANVIVVTGWSETFLKYSELIKMLYEHGFNVYTYDHQSQGLSGRWLVESQSTWVHSFDDYVDDFTYFATTFPGANNSSSQLPLYVVAHSMGGLISAIAMSRLPNLVSRAVLLAPMLRNKCGTKSMNYQFPLPQKLAYWISLVRMNVIFF